jgi:ankyrin repeat protein
MQKVLSLLLASLIVTACATQPIEFVVPGYIKAPWVVPFKVMLQEPLKKDEKLQLFIDNHLAYTLWSDKDLGIDFFSGRVRSPQGMLVAVVLRRDGERDEANVRLSQKESISIPEVADYQTDCKERAVAGEIRFLCKNEMGGEAYIGEIEILTAEGNIHVQLAPYASKNPYGWIKGDFQDAKIRAVRIEEEGAPTPRAAPEKRVEAPANIQVSEITVTDTRVASGTYEGRTRWRPGPPTSELRIGPGNIGFVYARLSNIEPGSTHTYFWKIYDPDGRLSEQSRKRTRTFKGSGRHTYRTLHFEPEYGLKKGKWKVDLEIDGKTVRQASFDLTDQEVTGKTAEVVAPGAATKGPRQANTELISAIRSGDVSAVKALLAAGADVNARDTVGGRPLHYAVGFGQKAIVDLLLSKGADVDGRAKDGVTPLYSAVSMGRTDMARLLIARGAEVNARTKSGYTPLIRAAFEGDLDFVKVLLAHGADVHATDVEGRSAFVWSLSAAWQSMLDWKDALKQLDATEQAEFRKEVEKLKGQWIGVSTLLIEHGADVDVNVGDYVPLYFAANLGDVGLVKALVDHGADLDDARAGETALHAAIAENHRDIAVLLVNAGADVNARNMSARTPLHFLANSTMDDRRLAELMIDHGADVNAKDKNGQTPLDFAVYSGNTPVADMLRRHGAR